MKLYRLYKNRLLIATLYFTYVVYLGLAFFESPAALQLETPFWATVIVEFLCLAFFLFRFFHSLLFIESKTFWSDTKNRTLAAILVLVVLDIVLYTILTEAGYNKGQVVRWSRPLRPFLIVNFAECRQARQGFRNIRRTLPEIGNVLFLFLANTALFALMAFKLNSYFDDGDALYFSTYADSFWSMYVLVTTANHPNVMMPAVRKTKWLAVFFVVYLIVNLYMFMSVFLAVVYNRFRCNLKQEVKEILERKEDLTGKVFEHALKSQSPSSSSSRRRITKETFVKLMNLAYSRYWRRNAAYFDAVWSVLDPKETGEADQEAFSELSEVLLLRFNDVADKRTFAEKISPSAFNSKPSRIVRSLVRHKRFRNVFDLVILVNAVCIGLDLDGGEQYFLAIFFFEIVLKMYAFGFSAFFKKAWNVFDTVVVGSALILSLAHLFQLSFKSTVALDFLMVLRVLRIFKVFHAFVRFRSVLNTLLNILPSMATYGSILFIIFYSFAIVGMDIFNKRIFPDRNPNCGNELLEDSEFVRNGYCANNFNDLHSSLLVLFEVLVVNQWHVLAEGHAAVTSQWAKLYFIAFHVVCVIMILNIFTAFVLEAFILEYTLSKSKVKSNLTDKISKMGLAFLKPGSSSTVRANMALEAYQKGLFEEDLRMDADADHEVPFGLDYDHEHDEGDDNNANNVEENRLKDYSAETSIRFVLTHKTRSVQHLLEKMFEKEVKSC